MKKENLIIKKYGCDTCDFNETGRPLSPGQNVQCSGKIGLKVKSWVFQCSDCASHSRLRQEIIELRNALIRAANLAHERGNTIKEMNPEYRTYNEGHFHALVETALGDTNSFKGDYENQLEWIRDQEKEEEQRKKRRSGP